MNRWLSVMLGVLLLAGCGDLKVADQSSSADNPGGAHGEQLMPISAVQLPNKKWEYHLSLGLDAVPGNKTVPFYQASFSDWVVVNGIGTNGRYEFIIQTYDRQCSLVYGGNYNLQSWAYLRDSKYYVETQDALGFGLQNGVLVKWNDFVAVQYGGTATDPAGVVGFTLRPDANELDIYLNMNHVAGSLANPYWFGDQTGYTKQPIEIIDSSGWAKKTVSMVDGQYIRFTFGGDSSVDTTWAYIRDSRFYKPSPDDILVVGRVGNTLVTR